jgi:phage terminase small subunit
VTLVATMPGDKPKLTPNQRRFVDEYLIDRNGVQAYFRAFGRKNKKGKNRSYFAANQAAMALLQNPTIRAELHAAERHQAKRCRIKADKVLAETAAIAFHDPIDLFDISDDVPKLRSVRDMPMRARKAIASIKVKRTPVYEYEDGKRVKMPDDESVIELKLWSKTDALDKLMTHLGLAREITPLDALLASLPPAVGERLRAALAGEVPGEGDQEQHGQAGSGI